MAKVDKITKRWIRNESDEKAVANGCRFDEERGQFVVDWAEQNLVLWEGEAAGQPLIAQDWQYDCAMRLFGWVRHSERWGREVRRFREALIGKPKKNKKSPTVAWWMLYLLDGDGEPGQNCYSAAKNGDQAKIVQNHAIKMVQASPTLSQHMVINKTTSAIVVEETNSAMKVLSSDNVRTQKAKEGLNGSCSIDELHVVDGEFVKRIARMGISRSEPMLIQVTTAGDDPTSYGKQRYDYGKRVEAGKFDNEAFFFDWHEAPQDLTDEELKADPIKFGKMANPAWGHTVGDEEYAADFAGCDTSSAFRDFKMYRLNIWQQGSNPWLDASDWDRNKKRIDDTVLGSCPAWAGLDLSRTRDMTSLCMAFTLPDGELHFKWWFWMPSDVAKQRMHVAPFLEWEQNEDACLRLTEGNWLDYEVFFNDLVSITGRYQLQRLLYDPRFADFPMQKLIYGEENSDGTMKRQPAEYEIKPQPQGPAAMLEPIEEFERLVKSGEMSHDGNPIAEWQAGHVSRGRNGLLVKPNGKDDIKTIDGMQAAAIATAGVETGEFSHAYANDGGGVVLF